MVWGSSTMTDRTSLHVVQEGSLGSTLGTTNRHLLLSRLLGVVDLGHFIVRLMNYTYYI